MRLVTYDRDGRAQPALLRQDHLVDLPGVASLMDLIRMGPEGAGLAAEALELPASRPLEGVLLLAPIPRPERFLMATGWNYLQHFEEGAGRRGDGVTDLPEHPSFFTKATGAVTGPYDGIPYDPKVTTKLDYEAEIAVVIGLGGRNIPVASVGRHLFGYMLANDVTARDVQRRHGGQWFKGKSLDRSCPMGPWLVTADEIGEGATLDLRCAVGGELVQEATTDLMIFSIPELVAALSEAMTLEPGDILLTGTPEGVGYARTPPRFLTPGDEVTVSSSLLGELRNRVVEQSLTAYATAADAHDPAR